MVAKSPVVPKSMPTMRSGRGSAVLSAILENDAAMSYRVRRYLLASQVNGDRVGASRKARCSLFILGSTLPDFQQGALLGPPTRDVDTEGLQRGGFTKALAVNGSPLLAVALNRNSPSLRACYTRVLRPQSRRTRQDERAIEAVGSFARV